MSPVFPSGSVEYVATAFLRAEESHGVGSMRFFAKEHEGRNGWRSSCDGYRARFASQLHRQLLCLNLNAGDPGSNETAIINRWALFSETCEPRRDGADFRLTVS